MTLLSNQDSQEEEHASVFYQVGVIYFYYGFQKFHGLNSLKFSLLFLLSLDLFLWCSVILIKYGNEEENMKYQISTFNQLIVFRISRHQHKFNKLFPICAIICYATMYSILSMELKGFWLSRIKIEYMHCNFAKWRDRRVFGWVGWR